MTQVIMRIVNPVDQDTVAKSVEGAGRQLLAELPALTKGQAVISGVGVNTPVMCRVRERLTRHGGETFDAPDEWARYHSKAEQQRREQDDAVLVSPPRPKKSGQGRAVPDLRRKGEPERPAVWLTACMFMMCRKIFVSSLFVTNMQAVRI